MYGCHAFKYLYMTDFVFEVNLLIIIIIIIIYRCKLLIMTLTLYRNTAKDIYITLSKDIIISLSRLKNAIITAEAVLNCEMNILLTSYALLHFVVSDERVHQGIQSASERPELI